MMITKLKEGHPKYLYLDQNFWIYLAQIEYGILNDLNLERILKALKNSVETGKIRILLNLTNILELQKHKNEEKKIRLAKFMLSLSKGYFFIPYVYLKRIELENAIRIRLHKPLINVREKSIGKGIFYMIHNGFPPIIKTPQGPIDSDKQIILDKKMQNEFSKDEVILKYILSGKFDKSNFNNTVKEFERLRQEGNKIKDKKYKKKLAIAQYFTLYLLDTFVEVCKSYNYNPKNLKFQEGMSKLIEFLKDLPMLYTNFILLRGLDLIPNHPINTNDIIDIYSFCYAIPYCDYVAGENYIIALAKSHNLDKIFNTKLYTKADFMEIKKILNGLI